MTEREQIEAEIRQLLATETRTTVLSNKLFQQGTGLFGKLAVTEDERRALVRSELFREAQARVRELQYRDADALREAVKVLNEQLPDTDVRLSLDVPIRAAS
ncbi:MAG: hypothetical protein J0I06_17385 [Planctomycetes bacterium]|nr:hypothetical protein [Planctomycetota bacterium]